MPPKIRREAIFFLDLSLCFFGMEGRMRLGGGVAGAEGVWWRGVDTGCLLGVRRGGDELDCVSGGR